MPPSGVVSSGVADRRARRRRLAAMIASTVSVFVAIAFAAPAGLGSGTTPAALKIKTKAGVFFVDDVVLSDRWPAGCDESDYSCDLSKPGFRVLTVWLKKGPGAKLNKLTDATAGVHVRASNGSRAKVYSAGFMSLAPFVAFTPRANAKGFKLHWPGNAPITLPKPTVQLGPS